MITTCLPALLLASLWGPTASAVDRELAGGDAQRSDEVSVQDSDAALAALRDAPLADVRVELLELAYGAASAFPLDPHIKNRSRAQHEVVLACVDLGQLARARRFADGIANWERGTGYAALAHELAKRGEVAAAERCLALALEAANTDPAAVDPERGQVWRRDRVLAGVAAVRLELGQREKAAALASGLEDSEAGRVEVAKAEHAGVEEFDARLNWVDEALRLGSFDHILGALKGCVTLFDRFYDDAPRRAAAEEKLRRGFAKMPLEVRVDLTMELCEAALRHDDPAKSLELTRDVDELLSRAEWQPELRIAKLGRLASLRHRSGGAEQARKDVESAFALYEKELHRITDIYRAGALRPLARARHVFGDHAEALRLYEMAVEAGMLNQNSRPRTTDLVETCCAMAIDDFRPDEQLLKRLREIRAGLGDPW